MMWGQGASSVCEFLSHKHIDLRLTSSTHVKKLGMVAHAEEVESGGGRSGQTAQLNW